MRKVIPILIGLMIFTITGCFKKVIGDERAAVDFIKSKGYKVTARKGEVQRYILEKDLLQFKMENTAYIDQWRVQAVDPDKYFGKEIKIYGFTVRNHPLGPMCGNAKKTEIRLFIMLTEGKVIGGYSLPIGNYEGSLSSLDGRTLEEVTGLSYQQWIENWSKKY